MWNLGNRGVIVLISALSGSAIIFKTWGPLLILVVSLFLVIYACYSLIVNDSLLSPHAIVLAKYLKEALLEVYTNLQDFFERTIRYARSSWQIVTDRIRERIYPTMERPRRTNYQLSSDSYSAEKSSSRHSSVPRLSPIPRNTHKTPRNDSGSENKFYHESPSSSCNRIAFGKHTSTPLLPREISTNGEFELFPSSQVSPNKLESPAYVQNQTPTKTDYTVLGESNGVPWSPGTNPKMRSKATGGKTVQTVAGPLLASTRYNIDPKIYSNVTSPGLATRLAKYAHEANSKLTHQSQYCAGQFPRVNLNASPIPLLNTKATRMRSPVTVRVAPPDATRYSPPGRQKILSHLCQGENKSPPSVMQVLREISLKRHASREDVTSEYPKKQRTDGIILEELESGEEVKQKRARDESSKSEEDISPQNKTVRPTKRTKTPSCYDILNSLSSSMHVAAGVKRKADFSRSGTPDFEKHFKPLDSTQMESLPQNLTLKCKIPDLRSGKSVDTLRLPDKPPDCPPIKGILKTSSKVVTSADSSKIGMRNTVVKENKKKLVDNTSAKPVKLTDKLFMRAEPERNEKLKLLADGERNIKPKFTTDDVEEIKKADIVNMRQTSMKARLQSMFDAISGKAASKINPDVVIEAEEVNVPESVPSPVTCATLNSSTTTTNVNTTPISTSAVVPASSTLGKNIPSPGGGLFNTPKLTNSLSTTVAVGSLPDTKTNTNLTLQTTNTTASSPILAAAPNIGTTTTTSSLKPTGISFGSPVTSTGNTSPAGRFSFGAVSSTSTQASTLTVTTTPLTTISSNILGSSGKTLASTSSSVNTNVFSSKNTIAKVSTPSTIQQASATQAPTGFTFGSSTPSTTLKSTFTVEQPATSSGETNNKAESTKAMTPALTSAVPSFKSILGTSTVSSSTTSTPVTTSAILPMFPSTTTATVFAFGNKTNNLQTSKTEGFAFGSSGNAGSTTTNAPNFGTVSSSQSITANTTTVTSTVSAQNASVTSSLTESFGTNAKSTGSIFGAPAPSTFSFGASTSSASSNIKPGFTFGASASKAATLTGTSSTTTTFTNAVSAVSSTSTTNNAAIPFGTTTASAAPQFKGVSSSSIFRQSNEQESGFRSTSNAFGAPSSSSTTSAFGTPATSSITSAFGVPSTSTTTNTFGPSSSSANNSAFGTPNTTETSNVFGTSSTTTASSAFGTPKTTVATPFGSNLPSSTGLTTTSSTSIFGAPAAITASHISTTSSTSIFGTNLGASATPNLFSNANVSTTANTNTTTSSSVFSDSTNVFGQSKPTMAFGATPGGFGSGTSLFTPQTTATPTFGTTSASNSIATPAFSNTNTSTATFGSIASQDAQNTAKQGFGNPPALFGSGGTATPAFGATASGFSTPVTNAFGTQNPSNSSFGTAGSSFSENKPSLFGTQGASTFGAPTTSAPVFGAAATSPPAFGAAPAAPAPAFGATNTNNANPTTGVFTFGNNQQTQPQQNTAFVFGNNPGQSNNPASTAPAPFQFGAAAATPAKPGGFNFNAPASTPSINFGTSGAPPPFNPSTPMFSIGSGSIAPRSRRTRKTK